MDDHFTAWLPDDEHRVVDLSKFSYEQFKAFVFDRPIAKQGEEYQLYQNGVDALWPSRLGVIVGYMTSLFREWPELAGVYSNEQMAQGADAMLSPILHFGEYIFDLKPPRDPGLARDMGIACIESMYVPFAHRFRNPKQANDYDPNGDSPDSVFYMWWDCVGHAFPLWHPPVARDLSRDAELIQRELRRDALVLGFAKLSRETQELGDAVLRTLTRLLQIEDGFCQHCALHGLGHLYHPKVKETVQSYLDSHRALLTEEEVQYAEACRDNTVL